MNVSLDRSPEAGQITCDSMTSSPRYPIMLQGTLRFSGDEALLTLVADYHVLPTHVVSRLVRDRGKNPNWPNPKPGQVPGQR